MIHELGKEKRLQGKKITNGNLIGKIDGYITGHNGEEYVWVWLDDTHKKVLWQLDADTVIGDADVDSGGDPVNINEGKASQEDYSNTGFNEETKREMENLSKGYDLKRFRL